MYKSASFHSMIAKAMRLSGGVVHNIKKPKITPNVISDSAEVIRNMTEGFKKASNGDLLSELLDMEKSAKYLFESPSSLHNIVRHNRDAGVFRHSGALIGGVANTVRGLNQNDPMGEGHGGTGILKNFAVGALVGGISGQTAGHLTMTGHASQMGKKMEALLEEGKGLDARINHLNTNKHMARKAYIDDYVKQHGIASKAGIYKLDLHTHSQRHGLSLEDAHEAIKDSHSDLFHGFEQAHTAKIDSLKARKTSLEPLLDLHNNLETNQAGFKVSDLASHLHAHGVHEDDILHHIRSIKNGAPTEAIRKSVGTMASRDFAVGSLDYNKKKQDMIDHLRNA